MPRKLIYTSAPRLLQAGRSGLGTVAMSRDIPKEVVKAAESFSQFSRQPGMENTRVVYSYRTVRCGDGIRHVLSCIRDAGADYSGRTNHLAEHLILDDSEARNCAIKGYTPAGVLLGTEWPPHDGYCGWIDTPVLWGSADPAPTWEWWKHHSGSGECRHNLCTQSALRGAVFAYDKGLERQTDEEARQVLCLFSESQQECADKGWGVTFTTNVEPNDELSDFRWLGVPENSPMLSKLQSSSAREWITLGTPPPARPVAAPAQARGSHAAAKGGRDVPLRGAGAPQASTAGQAVSGVIEPPPLRSGKTAASPDPSFVKLHGKKVVYAGIALIPLAAVVMLLWAVLTPPDVELDPASLKGTYNSGVHAAVIVKGPSKAVVGYAKSGSGSWSQEAPKDAGRYSLRLEIPGWWRTKVIPRHEVLVIAKQRPIVSFPDILDFVEDGNTHKVEPEIRTIPPGAPVEAEVQYRRKETGTEWTSSPPRNRGEYFVKVNTVESDNFESATEETLLRVSKPQESSPGRASSTPTETPESDATKVGLKDGPPPSEKPMRVVLVPEGNSLKLLPEISDLPATNAIQVQFRIVSRPTAWERLDVNWKEEAGLPIEKPRKFSDALEYQVSDGDRPVLRVLELADGSGASIQKLFKTRPFSLERIAERANAVRLGPQEFFGESLEILPANAYFEVSFESRKEISVPALEFRKGESGWEAKVPLEEVTREWEEAKQRQQPAEEMPSGSPAESFYSEVLKLLTRDVKEQDHEAATKVRALRPDVARLGENPKSSDIIKAVITDVTEVLDSFVPLSSPEARKKKEGKRQGAGDESLKGLPHHLLTPAELRGRLDGLNTDQQLFTAAKGWVNGRIGSVGSKDRDKPLRNLLNALSAGFARDVPQMRGNAPTNNDSEEAKEAANRLGRTSDFLKRLGVANSQPDGLGAQLSFVYSDNGQTARIILDEKIQIQPALPR